MKNPELTIYHRRLPHWRYDKSIYFVTWRLHRRQKPLTPAERDMVKSAIEYFEGSRYDLYAYVVMDDHVHILFNPKDKRRVQDIVYSWKSFTANKMQRETGRQGAIWQDEYFDRIVRSESEFLEKANYILNNPRKRWSDVKEYQWVGLGRSD